MHSSQSPAGCEIFMAREEKKNPNQEKCSSITVLLRLRSQRGMNLIPACIGWEAGKRKKHLEETCGAKRQCKSIKMHDFMHHNGKL